MPSRLSALMVLLCCAGSALAGPELAKPASKLDDAWKADWIANRNRIIESTPNLAYDPTSLIVRFNTVERGDAANQALIDAVGGKIIETWSILPGTYHITTSLSVEDAINTLVTLGGPAVDYAEPDYIVHALNTPNDPLYSRLWGMNNTGQTVNSDPGTNNDDIDAPQAWDIFTGTGTFVIADIDTGLLKTHEDLAANVWTNPGETAGDGVDNDGNGYVDDTWGWNFYSNTNDPTDDNGHGSHTAGTIGAVGNNGKGVVGVIWKCKIVPLKFLGSGGSGATSGAVSAINYCVTKGIKVSNNSWGGGGATTLANAINAARTAGHLFVCAAGNSGVNIDTSPSYPAAYTYDNIISVAAVDNDFNLASFSNYGVTGVDLAAPGVNVYSCYISGTSNSFYTYLNGTSMATPHVTGAVALVWSYYPNLTYSQVRSRILSTVRPAASLAGKVATGGVLNVYNALLPVAPPTITSNPSNVTTCAGVSASLSVAASGEGVFSYQWRRGTTNLTNSAEFSGVTTNTLTINPTSSADSGTNYNCVVTNAKGSSTSTNASVLICPADYNCDGFVDFYDFTDFVTCFEGDCPPGKTADFNGDGFPDFYDYTDFVTAFELGC